MYTIILLLFNYFNIHFIFHFIFIGLNSYVTCNLHGNQFCNWELNHKRLLHQYTSSGPTTGVWFILLHLDVRSLSSYRNAVAWDHQKDNNIIRARIIQCWERVKCSNEIELSRKITATDVTVDYFCTSVDECIIWLQDMWLDNEYDLKKQLDIKRKWYGVVFWYDAGRNMVKTKVQRGPVGVESEIKALFRSRPRHWGCMPSYIGG